METITIRAASPESARGMLAALSRFRAERVRRADGFYEVVISMKGETGEIVAILNALEEYVTARAAGPARLELGGRSYVMDPEEPRVDAPEP